MAGDENADVDGPFDSMADDFDTSFFLLIVENTELSFLANR